ncbi:cellulose biosynthesis cyclic di-GMP-binding regulatory protein BcsB [Paraburkholderia sp. Ac-20340]|uniref:cellulose biosynthesis cyclic di-GMP-binding regulatory protein BcsB n=1 Tax=Paraburkholderia sp. Ac-20340 TaxID=2703888 RepID=UPI00197D178A|nr:cellulose biosynthesis cyclic di-GMP-binding regulatory protein BcsB [Paraburkholderia sp. Ac-20340]
MSAGNLTSTRTLTCTLLRTRRLAARFGAGLAAIAALSLNVAMAQGAPAIAAASAAPMPASATQAAPSNAAPQASAESNTYTYRIPLLRDNAAAGLSLLGEDAYGGMDFGLRRDERVVSAKLVLDFRYSPTLLPALSHLNVLLNSVVGATIPLPEPAPAASTNTTIDLPVSLLTEFNHLNLELIAHSKASDQGNNPLSADLWLKAGPDSALELTVVPAAAASDLSQLPAPFFDARDVRRVNLPVVLPRAPGGTRLESAGIVTSWLGAQAGYRGSHFSASLGALPAHGHAVVLASRDELAGLGLSALTVDGPTLAIVPNPNDPAGRLLLVTGSDEEQLHTAATALALGARTFSGSQVRIDGPVSGAPRKPFDAPNWLPSDRPVELGELQPVDRFTVQGLRPGAIDVDLHLPPGLFGFDNSGAVLNLHYRYTARPESARSSLHVLAGNTPIQTLALPGDASDGHATMRIPTYLLPPLTTLQFDYRYEDVASKDNWQDVPSGPLLSAIDPTSTIDISHLPRYTAMPDLRLFGDAGFPFTRLADLSESAVILPAQPVADDYSAYLTLMGSMGQATGYPVLGVRVSSPAQVLKDDALRDKDLLVLASGDNQPVLKAWHDMLPRGFFGPVSARAHTLSTWWDKLTGSHAQAQRDADIAALYRSDDHDGMVAGLESPLAGGRSVVVISANSPAGLDAVVSVLQARRYRANDSLSGSLVVVHDGLLTTLNTDQSYFIGSLPLRLGIEWFFASHIVLLLFATLGSVVLIGLLGGVLLHRRALNRLDLAIPQTSQREEGRRGSHV